MPDKQRKLVLVDGSSYLYRAFHALPPLANSAGEPTGAILGVLNMLQKLVKDEDPEFMAVVFDAPGRTFRDDLFDQYKANRTPMPDQLTPQVEPLIAAVIGMGLPMLRLPGVEADDVIGTLACQAAALGYKVLISTGDKDMAQLVDGNVSLVNTMTGTTLDRAGVKAKFDVYPEQIADYLALVGDTIDNIPGVPKVGPKTAAKWLAEYTTLDDLLAGIGQVPGKVGDSLRDNLEQLELSRKLARIDTRLDLGIAIDELARKPPDVPTLRSLYGRLELRSLLRHLGDGAPGDGADLAAGSAATAPVAPATGLARIDGEYTTLLTTAALRSWLDGLDPAQPLALGVEGSLPAYMDTTLTGIALATGPASAIYIPVDHDASVAPEQPDRAAVLTMLRPLLESDLPKIGHNLKHAAHVLANHDIRLRGLRHDVMLESYVLNSTAIRHDIDAIARRYLQIETPPLEEIAGKGVRALAFAKVPLPHATRYAASRVDAALRAHHALRPQIESLPGVRSLYESVELPLLPVLLAMERQGVRLDEAMLAQQSRELATRLVDLQARAHAAAGTSFNLESPRQLQEILFERLRIPVLRRTPTGQPSTAEDVLEELASTYELPGVILEYRGVAKLKSTYTDKLPSEIRASTQRVHTSYHQAVAATGRLSSADPNLQNIPIRTLEGRRIRQAFTAPPGYVLLAADYSQIELRIMAHLSGDAGLVQAFARDGDIHRATAAEVFGIPEPEAVTADQRRSAKAINFGLIYGMSAFGLGRQLGLPRSEAQRYVDLYFERYPGVRRYMESTRQIAREQGYVETVFGRRLYLPDIRARNSALRQYAERSAINAPMQGTAADIIKLAMIDIHAWLVESGIDGRLTMQVHDELVFEVREEAVAAVVPEIRARMSRAARLAVPLKVDVGSGRNWDEAH